MDTLSPEMAPKSALSLGHPAGRQAIHHCRTRDTPRVSHCFRELPDKTIGDLNVTPYDLLIACPRRGDVERPQCLPNSAPPSPTAVAHTEQFVATVVSVNMTTREVVLRTPDGKQRSSPGRMLPT